MVEYIKRRTANRMLYDVYEHAMKHELSRSVTIPTVEAKNILLRFEKALNAVPAADVAEIGSCVGCYYKMIGRHQKCSCCRRNKYLKDNYIPKERDSNYELSCNDKF